MLLINLLYSPLKKSFSEISTFLFLTCLQCIFIQNSQSLNTFINILKSEMFQLYFQNDIKLTEIQLTSTLTSRENVL